MPSAQCGRLKPNRPARWQAPDNFCRPAQRRRLRQQLSRSRRRVDCLGFLFITPVALFRSPTQMLQTVTFQPQNRGLSY
jgi:hypothetical protein